jgi:hypothetical protein
MMSGLWHRLVHGEQRAVERADWADFAGPGWRDGIMTLGVTDDFHAKQGRSTGRVLLQAGERSLAVYLKRHYRLPRLYGWLATLWPGHGWSPALQEARHLDWAMRQGVPVPAVVAAGESIGPWGKLQSFLAVEELTGMLPLHHAVPEAFRKMAPLVFPGWKRGLVAEMARLAAELHSRRSFHKDLYLCHFYIPSDDTTLPPANWRGRVHLIDFHRLGMHPVLWRLWQVKDLAQLLYSSELPGVTARDRLRFWKIYRQSRKGLDQWWLRRAVVLKGLRYRQHNQKKRAA